MTPELMVVASTLGGGTGSHLTRLLRELSRTGWSIRLLSHDREAIPVPPEIRFIHDTRRGPLHRFPLAQAGQLRRLRTQLRAAPPDVVHTYFFWPIIYGRLLKRVGVVDHLVENREDEGFDWSPNDYRILRATSHLPDRIVCVSESVREIVLDRESVPVERVVVIRNGVSVPELPPQPNPEIELRRELDLRPEHLVVGMVANLNRAVKGVQHFIDALPLIAERVSDARFVVVGEGPDREALLARAEGLGMAERIRFVGFRTDVERFYRMMDVSVLTSLSEGLSITILESMSHAVPVVATRVGGNPELVREEETGLLVPPADPESFATAVSRVLEDRPFREKLGRAGRRRVETEFALPEVARRYDALYRELMARGHGPAGAPRGAKLEGAR